MPSARTTARLAAALLVVLSSVAAAALAACGVEAAPSAVIAQPEGDAASVAAARGETRSLRAGPAGVAEPGEQWLEAARTVQLYCRLIAAGQLARAGDLCLRRRLWSRRALGTVGEFGFRSARVYAAPDARTLVLKAWVRVRAGRGCPLPDGLAPVFFTLGRAGSAVGGWRISAVSTSP